MHILVLNSGSSSIKCQYFIDQKSVASLKIERIGEKQSYSELRFYGKTISDTQKISDHMHALEKLISMFQEAGILDTATPMDAIGHRVVHGGSSFKNPAPITQDVIESIRLLSSLAPLHNPANLKGIEFMHKKYRDTMQIAVFDTAFHHTMPDYAFIYPLPYTLYEKSSIRRYGFHGTSHAYVAREAAKMMKKELNTLNLITLHLGNGASATAIESGKSIDTSMGFTPLEGLMMGTRSGDIDPAIVPFLEHNLGMDIDAIDKMLNKESGLQGICGSNDMREIISQAKKDDALSALALKMFTYRIKKYIGAYFAVLGHVDAIVFTGGIGVHAKEVREMVCEGLEASIGLKINSVQNYSESKENRPIHEQESSIKLFIIQTNEELEIALQCEQYLEGKKSLQ